jgi:propionyl-CoA carboxylase alpha chain
VDDGFREGMTVPVYYDPMIAKLIVHAPTRREAIGRMITAIDNYHIEGIETTLFFGRFVFQHPAFRDGSFGTDFVGRYFSPDAVADQDEQLQQVAALFAAYLHDHAQDTLTVAQSTSTAWQHRRH